MMIIVESLSMDTTHGAKRIWKDEDREQKAKRSSFSWVSDNHDNNKNHLDNDIH